MKWIQKPIRTSFNENKDTYIKNLKEASNRIIEHINKGSKIAVYTDFDVDGLGCSCVWDWFFEQINYNYILKIPHRSEGYGLSSKWIDLHKQVDLIITADNGISKVKEVAQAKKYGIDVIVTDHHNPQDELPNCLIVNPKCGSSDFTRELCGTGVSWYLIREILIQMKHKANAMQIIDMVAISTIADLVELDGANRAIVKHGLKMINNKRFSSNGLEKLFSRYDQEIFSDTVAFGVAPILNACGRLEDMNEAFYYLRRDKLDLYDKLIEINEKRKDIQHKFSEMATNEVDTSKNIIIYNNDDIPKGCIGLVAGDLCNKFYKPTIVLANNHGSGRGIDDIDLYDLVFNSGNEFISSGGGHKSAMGIGVSSFEDFKNKLENHCEENITSDQLLPRKYYWKEIRDSELKEVYEYLESLEPFGMGNEKLNIVLKGQIIEDYSLVGKQRNVLQIKLTSGIKCIRFKYDNDWDIKIGDTIDILGSVSKNIWNGFTSYQLMIEDIRIK